MTDSVCIAVDWADHLLPIAVMAQTISRVLQQGKLCPRLEGQGVATDGLAVGYDVSGEGILDFA